MTDGFSVLDAAAAALLAASLFFSLTAAVGVLRLPDFYTRLHAVGKCDTAGLALAAAGFALLAEDGATAVKLLLVAAFLAAASPTATHALGRAARRAGVPAWRPPDAAERPDPAA